MNRKLLILSAALLLCSCGDGVLDSEHSQDAKPKLHVALTDYSDGNPIAGASLSIQSTSKTAKTAENGTAVFEDLSVGNHTLRIEAQGYATAIVTAYVNEITRVGEAGRATQLSQRLYHKSAALEGYVQHTDSKGQIKALASLPVRITFNSSCNFAETVSETALTDSKGYFQFENLPATDSGCSYSIETAGAAIDGQTYNAMTLRSGLSDLRKGRKTTAAPIDVANGVGLFTVVNYNREISNGEESAPIVFTFSENIAANQQGNVRIPNVGYTVEIKDNSVTFKPVSRWEEGNFIVYFQSLKSESGKTYGGNLSVTVFSKDISSLAVQELKLAPGFSIAYAANTASITFKKLDGASVTGYNYYLEENGKVSKLSCSTTPPSTGNTIVTATCPIALDSLNAAHRARIGDSENKLIVQAYNAQYESQKAELLIKETKPEAPKLASGTRICVPSIEKGKILNPYSDCDSRTQYISDVNNLLSSFSAEIMRALGSARESAEEYSGSIFFSRAMDITKPAAFALADCAAVSGANPCSRLEIKYEYLNEQVLNVKLKVKAGTALTGAVNTNITIKNLTGNNALLFDDGSSVSNLVVNLAGAIPSLCEIDPFANTCTSGEKLTFCNNLERYSATPGCQELYPNPCNDLSNLKGTSRCPLMRIFFEDFESGNSFGTVYSGTNRWVRGTGTTANSGSYSAYISGDGSSYSYNESTASNARMYTRITFPYTSDYNISFYWKGIAETTYDFMVVCLIPESEGTEGCSFSSSYKIGRTLYSGSEYWGKEDIPRSVSSGSYYLIFYWQNDTSVGYSPIAIDDITVVRD